MLVTAILSAALTWLPQAPDTLHVASISADRDVVATSSAFVQKVGSSRISSSGARSLSEVLGRVAGISVRDYGGIGGLKTVSVRNLGSQHSAIVHDGINVSDTQNGQVDISRFDMDNVEEVTVSIAGSGDIWRSARTLSSAGTVSIRTREPELDSLHTRASVRMSAASFGQWNPYLLVQQRIADGWSISGSASGLVSDGSYPFMLYNGKNVSRERRLNSDVHKIGGEADLRGRTAGGGKLLLRFSGTGSERGLPGSVILYVQNPTERLWESNMGASASYEKRSADALDWKAALSWSDSKERYENTDAVYPVPVCDRYHQQEFSGSGNVLWELGPWSASVAQDLWVNTLATNLGNDRSPVRLSSMSAMAGRYSNGRLDANMNLLLTLNHEWVANGAASKPVRRLSPSLNLSWKPLNDKDLRLRAAIRDAFRVPTFNDLYYPRVGSVVLRPERSFQTDLGVTWSRHDENFSACATADIYYYNVRDKIVATPTMFIWRMRNLGRVDMFGADLTGNMGWRVASWAKLDANANLSLCRAVDVTDPTSGSYMNQIAYTPRISGNAGLSLETPWITATYILNAAGRRWCLGQNTDDSLLEAYADHGLSLTRTFRPKGRHVPAIELGAQAMNLGNVNYEIIKSYPMPGFNWRATIKLTY